MTTASFSTWSVRAAALLSAVLLGALPLCGAGVPTISADPYIGAIALDAATGKVLFEENADVPGYPASCIKLMDLLITLEKVKAGKLSLGDKVTVTAQAARIGGSQAYLKEGEVFTLDELLYALIVKSANDGATALAIHVAGSPEGFVQLMNQRARELGMRDTVFHSVHGLPPSAGQQPDVSSSRDLAVLGRELLKHPDALRYTSTQVRMLRQPPAPQLEMRNHNRLLGVVEGVDGLKTGYFHAGGFSMVASAQRNNRHVIVVVLGSTTKDIRDRKTKEMLARAFLELPPPQKKPGPRFVAVAQTNRLSEDALLKERAAQRGGWVKPTLIIACLVLALAILVNLVMSYRRNRNLQ
jgi:D-alanyl-D-alanine carboxypeptidase (penicillin-binding protein 5/6)